MSVRDKVHILSTEYAHSKHCIWNESDRSLQRLQVDFPRTIHRVAMVHVPSKDIFVVIRWYGVWTYCLSDGHWTHLLALRDGVAMTHLSAVLTANQKHVIITGRKRTALQTCGYIKVLDIEEGDGHYFSGGHVRIRLRQTAIRVDSVSAGWMWKSSDPVQDERLVIGFIEGLFRSEMFQDSGLYPPPLYIMRFICQWYSEEMVHWVAKYEYNHDETRTHRAMSVRDILKYTK